MNVRDDTAVETAAAGATAVKVKFLTAGDESCAPDVVGEIPHEVLEGAAAFAIVLAFAENQPKIAESLAEQVAIAQVGMGGELGDGERVLGVDAVKADGVEHGLGDALGVEFADHVQEFECVAQHTVGARFAGEIAAIVVVWVEEEDEVVAVKHGNARHVLDGVRILRGREFVGQQVEVAGAVLAGHRPFEADGGVGMLGVNADGDFHSNQ